MDALEVSESRALLQELTAILEEIKVVDLNSYQTLKDVYDRSGSLLETDRKMLDAKLDPIIEAYSELAKAINNEYATAKEIENKYFVVIVCIAQSLAVLAFVSMKGKRWF